MWKCIICDDEEMTREGLTLLIKSMRNDIEIVDTAASGEEAIEKIRQKKPNIVLIDINMPLKNGLEVMSTITPEFPNIKFIIISGYSDFEYAQKALRYHAVDYLLKPVDFETLNEVLNRCIQQIKDHLNTSKIIVPENVNQKLSTQILHYLQSNYRNTDCTLESTSLHFNLSASYVSKLIKQETQMTFTEIINAKRIEYAKSMLINEPQALMIEISEACGFSSQHYFCRVFKNLTGISPNEYRTINIKTDNH